MSNQRTNLPPQRPLAQFSPHKAESFSTQIICGQAVAGAAVIVQGPNYKVPPGASITFHSTSQAAPGADDVLISSLYENLTVIGGSVLRVIAGSSAVLPFAVDNLNELWFSVGPNGTHGGSVGVIVVAPRVE